MDHLQRIAVRTKPFGLQTFTSPTTGHGRTVPVDLRNEALVHVFMPPWRKHWEKRGGSGKGSKEFLEKNKDDLFPPQVPQFLHASSYW